VEVGTQFVRQWRGFFDRLENIHHLNIQNPGHIWLIHYLFLDDLNKDCAEFQGNWNHHPVSRFGHEKTPAASVVSLSPIVATD
jgi:hypothetical protein